MNLDTAWKKYKGAHKDAPLYDWYDSVLSQQEKTKVTKSLKGYEQTPEYKKKRESKLELACDFVVEKLAEAYPSWHHMPYEMRGPFTKRWVELEAYVVKTLKLEDPHVPNTP